MRTSSCSFPVVLSLLLALIACGGSSNNIISAPPPPVDNSGVTTTPIKHVIIIVGENRSFDNLFATYQPPDRTQTVWNLLSQHIVTASGSPGVNFSRAAQQQATDTSVYQISPTQTGPFTMLPQPNVSLTALLLPPSMEYGIKSDPALAPGDQSLLNQGGVFPQYKAFPDNRFPATLPNGPFPITQHVPYYATVGDPMHRFYQMWQQIDCSAAHITTSNPSGCLSDLFPWVATSIGWGPLVPNIPPPAPFTDQITFQGAVSMGFYNMAAGDVPYFASLANQYAINDNYHQFMLGGTGPNSIAIATADPLIYRDANAQPATPPPSQIENPDPYPGSNNWYQQEGFNLSDAGNTSNSSYTNCSDITQPGVLAISQYLAALPYKPFNNGSCALGNYYLLNNQLPAYNRDGSLRMDQSHTVGPSTVPTIGDALQAAHISWAYYGEGYSPGLGSVYSHYCDICNPFEYTKSIMTTGLISNIKDLSQFFQDLQNGSLPAVSILKPDDIVDAHPGSFTPRLFEAMCRNVIDSVKAQDSTWQQTAIFITLDESGGTYDSGYIQPLDFFGDGPRIPLIIVSPLAKSGYVDHTYADHASLLKFIEKNWNLQPLSSRSRDNLPNPTSAPATPYFPTNSPAIGDLMTAFKLSP